MNLDKVKKHIAATVLAVLLLGTAAGQARAAGITAPSAPPPAPVATQTTTDNTATTEESQARQIQYGQRETQSPQAANFKGGAVGLFIGGSTLAVVLLIVLLVILL